MYLFTFFVICCEGQGGCDVLNPTNVFQYEKHGAFMMLLYRHFYFVKLIETKGFF